MRIRDLEYLQEIVYCKSMSRAAQKLNISQQNLSRIVHALEEECSIKIFRRSRQGLDLTDDGVQFLSCTRDILREYQEMQKIGAHQEVKSSICIGLDKHITAPYFHKVLDILDHFPDIRFSIHMFDSATDALKNFSVYNIDFAITLFAAPGLALLSSFPEIEYRMLAEESIYMVAHKDLPIAHAEAVSIFDLLKYPCVFNKNDNIYHHLLRESTAQNIHVFLETDNVNLQLEAIRKKYAVGVLDGFSLQFVWNQQPDLMAVPLLEDGSIFLSLLSDSKNPAELKQAFRRRIVETFAR